MYLLSNKCSVQLVWITTMCITVHARNHSIA